MTVGQIVIPDEGAAYLARLNERLRVRDRRSEDRDRLAALLGGDPVFLAEIYPDEGLDYLTNIMPRATQAVPSTLYMGLFSSQTPTTVPAHDAVMATQTGVAELTSTGGYARASVGSNAWPAGVLNGSGWRTTMVSPGISFPQSSGAYSGSANGFFIATSASIGAGIALFYSNFSDGVAITVNAAGFTPRVAAYWHSDG